MVRGLALSEPEKPNMKEPHGRNWIDEEYRRITTVPFGTPGTHSPKSTRPGLAGPFDAQHEGIPDPANMPTNESFYECSLCAQRISRGEALQRAWGDKADSLLRHPMLEEAAP